MGMVSQKSTISAARHRFRPAPGGPSERGNPGKGLDGLRRQQARELSTHLKSIHIGRARLAASSARGNPARMGLLSDHRQVTSLLQRYGPVVHLRDADACGVPRSVLLRLQHRGDLLRIAKAAFVHAADFSAASGTEQFRLRAIGFGLCSGPDVHLTGAASALLLGLPLLTPPTGLPTGIRPGDPHIGHDRTPYGRTRHGHLPIVHRTTRSRVATVSPAFCAVDVARHAGSLDGLAITDAVLHGGVDRATVQLLIGQMLNYPGIASAQWASEHADPRCESPLETLGRYAFISAGLPPPLSNAWVWNGSQWFRVDHLLPEDGVVLEADGAVKYNNRSDADSVVAGEKERERLLRSAGFGVARYTWADAANRPWVIPARAREVAELRTGRPAPTCWQLDAPTDGFAAARPNSFAM